MNFTSTTADTELHREIAYGRNYRSTLLSQTLPNLAPKRRKTKPKPTKSWTFNRKLLKRLNKAKKFSLLERYAYTQDEYMRVLAVPRRINKKATAKKVKKTKKITKQPCPIHIKQLAEPNKRLVYETWRQYQDILAPEALVRLDQTLHHDSYQLELDEAETYFNQLDREKLGKSRRKRHRLKIASKRLRKEIRKMAKILCNLIKQVNFTQLSATQLIISDEIGDFLVKKRVLKKKPMRNSRSTYQKTLVEICDKLAACFDRISRGEDLFEEEKGEEEEEESIEEFIRRLLLSLIQDATAEELESIEDFIRRLLLSMIPEEEQEDLAAIEAYIRQLLLSILPKHEIKAKEDQAAVEDFIRSLLDSMIPKEKKRPSKRVSKRAEAGKGDRLRKEEEEAAAAAAKRARALSKARKAEEARRLAERKEATDFVNQLLSSLIDKAIVEEKPPEDDDFIKRLLSSMITAAAAKKPEDLGDLEEFLKQLLLSAINEAIEQKPISKEELEAIEAYIRQLLASILDELIKPQIDREALDKLIKILEASPDDYLDAFLDESIWPTTTNRDLIEILKQLRDGLVELRDVDNEQAEHLAKLIKNWAINNRPDEIDNNILQQIDLISRTIATLLDEEEFRREQELIARIIPKHEPPITYEHAPDTVCCLSLKIWSIWLVEITHNLHNWTKWCVLIIRQIRDYSTRIRNPTIKVYKSEWQRFCNATQEKIEMWQKYSQHVQKLSNEIIENFHGKSVNCCPACLYDQKIPDVVQAHETIQALVEAIMCAAHWHRCLDKIVEKAGTISDIELLTLSGESSSTESTAEIAEIDQIDDYDSDESLYEIEEIRRK